jgi:hypothetical protein
MLSSCSLAKYWDPLRVDLDEAIFDYFGLVA